MAYAKIENLYRRPEYLKLFRTVYVLEKIHGTSAHIKFYDKTDLSTKPEVHLFSGGANSLQFSTLFDKQELLDIYNAGTLVGRCVTLYGEAYGGRVQSMKSTYGDKLRFIVFEVQVDDKWLEVPNAENVAKRFNQEFVWYKEVENTLDNLNTYKDQPSQLAILRGLGNDKMAEGIVTKPIYECYDKQGGRWILKHKRDDFSEIRTPREVDPEAKMNILRGQEVADDFVTPMRLAHILDKNPFSTLQDIPQVIKAMLEDVTVECSEEYVDSKIVQKAIASKTVHLYKTYLNTLLLEGKPREVSSVSNN